MMMMMMMMMTKLKMSSGLMVCQPMSVIWYFMASHILHKNICCGYSLEVSLMSTHNICFYGEI